MDINCINTIDCKQGAVRAVRFNVDGNYALTCGSDRKIKLWNPYSSLLLKTYGGHADDVLDACGSCDSSQIVSCSKDKSIILWDVSTGQSIRRYRGHSSGVSCVKFNEESSLIISGSMDNTLMIWDCKSRNTDAVQVLREAKDCITCVKVTDHEIFAGSVDCCVRRYDVRKGEMQADFVGAPITSISLTHDGQCVLVGSADDIIRLLDKTNGELLGEYKGHRLEDLTIESDIITSDNLILSGSVMGDLFIWDLVSSEVVRKLIHTPGRALTSISVHPRKDIVLSASIQTVKVWGRDEDVPESIVRDKE